MQRISVTLPEDVAELFYTKVAKGNRSKFIADAIKKALSKEEKLLAFQSLVNFAPFDVSKESTEVLREIRKSRQEEVAKKGK